MVLRRRPTTTHLPPPVNLPVRPSLLMRTIGGQEKHEVVGESYRQDAFEQTVGPRTEDGPTIEYVTVQLAREPSNQQDPNAVAVFIGTTHVGYIPRERTAAWHPVIDHLHQTGRAVASIGQVVGGWSRANGDTGSYGLIVFASDPPRRIAPFDASIVGDDWINVQGEDKCQNFLISLAQSQTEKPFVVGLYLDDSQRVTAAFDRQILGTMTSKMTKRYTPIVNGLRASGWPANCEARVKQGKKKVEVQLRLPTRNHLEEVHRGLTPTSST